MSEITRAGTGTMMDVWINAQKQLWDTWMKGFQGAPTPVTFYPDLVEQWRKMATQGMDFWTGGGDPRTKYFSGQAMSAQAATLRFIEYSMSAWQMIMPKVESGGDWGSSLTSYSQQIMNQMFQLPSSLMQMTQDSGELWQLYMEEMQNIVRPWSDSLQRSPMHFGEALTGGGTELIELTNLYWDAYERTFGRLLQSPRMGFSRELDEKLLRGFDAWTDARRASIEYQAILAEAWAKVFEEIMRELVARSLRGEPVTGIRDMLRLWTEVADRELEVAFQQENYLQAQSRLFNTTMTYRLHEQEVVETYLENTYIPTRSEVDEMHKTIYELRKEMKALKKSMRAAGMMDMSGNIKALSATQEKPAAEKPAPRKRPSRAKSSSSSNNSSQE